MDINFLPEEDRKNRLRQGGKEHQLPKEEEKWSSPHEIGEIKNKLAEKKGVRKYLPDLTNFFKENNKDSSRLADTKKTRESRKELLKFSDQQKTENGRILPPNKEKIKEVLRPINEVRERQTQDVNNNYAKEKILESGAKEKAGELEIKLKNKKNWIKLLNFSGWLSSFFGTLKKVKEAGPKDNVIRTDFLKGEDAKIREKLVEKKEEGEAESREEKEILRQARGREEKKEKEIFLAEEQKSSHAMETNLIKDEIIIFFDWKKGITSLFIWVFLVILALSGVYGLLSWQAAEKVKASQVSAQRFAEIDKEIRTVEQEAVEALVFKKKLSLVNSILSQHIYWTNFFKFLEENTLANAFYLGFTGDNKGQYTLSTNAKDFYSIEAQVKKFLEDKRVLKASVSQATVSGGGKKAGESADVNFGLDLTIDPSIFTK